MKVRIAKIWNADLSHQDFNKFTDGPCGTLLRALKTLTSEHNNPSIINVTISIIEMLIDNKKTLVEFEDGSSGTQIKALTTLTIKKLVNKITP